MVDLMKVDYLGKGRLQSIEWAPFTSNLPSSHQGWDLIESLIEFDCLENVHRWKTCRILTSWTWKKIAYYSTK